MTSKVQFQYRETAFSRRLITFSIVNVEHIDVKEFLSESYSYFERELRTIWNKNDGVKVNAYLGAVFEKPIVENLPHHADANEDNDNNDETANRVQVKKIKQDLHIHTRSIIILKDSDLQEIFKESILMPIVRRIDEAILQGSGYTLSSIKELVVEVNKYDPLRGSSYLKLPNYLANKHAIINIKNADNKCFMWSILAALHPAQRNADRLNNYIQYRNELKFTGIEFPVRVNSIDKFEKLNESISISVYMYDAKKQKVLPLRMTNNVKEKHIHLLLLSQETHCTESEELNQDYIIVGSKT